MLFCAFYALSFGKEVFKAVQGRRSNPSVRFLPIVDIVRVKDKKREYSCSQAALKDKDSMALLLKRKYKEMGNKKRFPQEALFMIFRVFRLLRFPSAFRA